MSWEEKVRSVVPYVPGEQPKFPDMIKINTNECPYPPSPLAAQELTLMNASDFRLYPDAEASELVKSLASYYRVPEDRIFVGVGSDDVLAQIFLTFFTNGNVLLFPEITYSFYEVWADLYRIPYEKVPLTDDWHIQMMSRPDAGGIIFANPNAPTGIYEPLSFVEEMVKNHPDCVVVVDEAYIDFGSESAIPLTEKYDNLLVVQTFSKSRAMAGMRIGFAIGNPKLISYLKDVKYSINSYTMNMPSIRIGVATLRDEEYFKEITQKIIATREETKEKLKALGFEMTDSATNFLFIRHPRVSGKELFEALRSQNIFVRRFDIPGIEDYLRVTIGTPEQMDRVISFLEVYLK
ncbi:MAG: histidinol-phosphate transaminase [Lachnospiraceae bacterium]|nr:histidinol-phosphate transaminase [Lachnospiraceae bacterium]